MRTNRFAPWGMAAVVCLGLGCGSSDPEPEAGAGEESEGGEAPAAASAEPATFAEQVSAGQQLYGTHCASCHGASGQGSADAPRVVGLAEGALPLDPPSSARARTAQFRTVADVAGFVVQNMPPGHGGSLPEHEYWSILAFDLHANGIDLEQKLDGALAATLVIPR